MAFVEIENVSKRFGQVLAVDHLSLRVEREEFLTLLGPSGCGKTTVLRMIAGLEIPDQGEIKINDKTVFSSSEGIFVPPGKRGVGLVFQSYALWPHMSVFQNVAFGLQVQRVDKLNLKDRVTTSLQYMHLQGMEQRYPQEMSGGQQQRVALARMLVSRPSIFLMDEPLSNLDAKLRMEMRAEIKRIHRESQATTVYVTHDQIEALTLSTRVAVMEKGVLQQVGPPQEIYRQPANLFVADFIGSPTINFIPGRIVREAGGVFLEAEDFSLPMLFKDFSDKNLYGEDLIGKKIIAAIRPEDIHISAKEEKGAISGNVYSILPAGADVTVQVKRGDLTFSIREMGEISLAVGDKTYIQFSMEAMLLYDQEKGTLLFPHR